MNDNGVFRRKNGFTITGNTVVRDIRLSMKAIGLYVRIMSYITLDDFMLTKSFIKSKCQEKEKAFDSAWNELKERVLFGKLDDASSVTLNATAWCWNHTDATDYIKLNCHFI